MGYLLDWWLNKPDEGISDTSWTAFLNTMSIVLLSGGFGYRNPYADLLQTGGKATQDFLPGRRLCSLYPDVFRFLVGCCWGHGCARSVFAVCRYTGYYTGRVRYFVETCNR